jgi:hypothetical protein
VAVDWAQMKLLQNALKPALNFTFELSFKLVSTDEVDELSRPPRHPVE